MARWLKIVLGVAVLLAVAAAIGYAVWTERLRSRFEAKVAAIAARGEPTTLADLVPPPIRDNENGAVLYLRAFAHPCFRPEDSSWYVWSLMRDGKPLTAEESAEGRSIVTRAREPLELLREAAARSACRFPTDCGSSGDMFTYRVRYDSLPMGFQLLQIAIRFEIEDGRVDNALRDCVVLLKIAGTILADARHAVDGVGWQGKVETYGQSILNGGEPSAEAIRVFQEALGDVEDRAPLLTAIMVERCRMIDVCCQVIRDRRGAFRRWSFPAGWETWETKIAWSLVPSLAWPDAGRYLDRMGPMIELAAKPYYARGQPPSTGDWGSDQLLSDPPWGRPFSLQAGFPIERCLAINDLSEARLACLKVALALRLYRLKHREYPEALAALAPEFIDKLPVDPFSGKDLVYRREGKGFVVYSVGPDGVDDNGTRAAGEGATGDIVFRVSR